MKDSGVDWIGEVPLDWEITKIKFKYDVILGKMVQPEQNDESDFRVSYFKAKNIQEGYIRKDFEEMYVNKADIKKYEIKSGDVLVCEGGDVGRAVVCKNDYPNMVIQNSLHRVRGKKQNDVRLIYHYLYMIRKYGFMDVMVNRATIAHFTKEKFDNLDFIISPVYEEQTKIANFLDDKISQLDAIIEKSRASIEKLQAYRKSVIYEAVTKGLDKTAPMKDSGVKWIGESPVGWRVSRFKYEVSTPITDGPHETPELVDVGIPFASAESIKNGIIDLNFIRGYISEKDHRQFSKKVRPQRDDIYIVKSGAGTGKSGIVITDEVFDIWSPLALIRTCPTVNYQKYFFHFINSETFVKQVENRWSYGTQQNIGMNVLEDLYVTVPPITDQKSIADYLDTKTNEIDAAINKLNQLIQTTEKTKKSIIYEYVTGKKRVPEFNTGGV